MYFVTEKIGRIRGLPLSEIGAQCNIPRFGLPRRCDYKVPESTALPSNRSKEMPSVGMRRSTRVFGARVLRSGRRLWTESQGGSKCLRLAHAVNDLMENSDDGGGYADRRLKAEAQENENGEAMDIVVEPNLEENASEDGVETKNVDRMFGIVYRRKRKRDASTLSEDKRFGKQFVRKQWRKRCRVAEPSEVCRDVHGSMNRLREVAIVVCESSNYDSRYWITCFLTSVLIYMTKARIRMRQLSAFVLRKPIFDAYLSHGVLFLQDSNMIKTPGICIISRSRSLIPMFLVDFSAIPFCFMDMHRCMYLRSLYLPGKLVAQRLDDDEKDEEMIDLVEDVKELSFPIPSVRDHSDFIAVGSPVSSWGDIRDNDNLASSNVDSADSAPSAVGLNKSSLRNIKLQNNRIIQKRRSSLRRRVGRPPLPFRAKKTSGALASDFLRIRHDGSQLASAAPSRMLRSSDKRSSAACFKEIKSNVGVLAQNIGSRSCSVNLLIIETDKCYREEGAIVTLEQSASKRWSLAVKKNGIKRYTLTAQKVMRVSCSNRFTHATIWAGTDGWKLEFLNKQDWLIFKEIYKECWEKNAQAGNSVIPIPKVQVVSSPDDSNFVPYVRPDSYIRVKDDELTRALLKKSASYDMDSDDEEWLKKFNEEFYVDRAVEEVISPDKFELIIDALEKGFHSNGEEFYDEQATDDSLMRMERKEVVDAIHDYWNKKRKQKSSALVRIFQLYQQPRKAQVIPKSVLRKKRSFKRQASKGWRGKPQTFLRHARPLEIEVPAAIALTAEQDALEQETNLHKVKETKAAVDRSEGLAVLKRQRAQRLMENADLATYKALVALKISEAAQFAESSDTVASIFHD